MNQSLDSLDLVVMDVETTGLSPLRGDRICEIGAIRWRGDAEVARFHSFVNPCRPVSPGAFAVNQITPEMLADAPVASDVLPGFLAFLDGAVLAAYNASFDLDFLDAELRHAGLTRPASPVLDVLQLARRCLPHLPRHPLWAVARVLGVAETQSHRALGDVEITGRLLHHFLSTLRTEGAVTIDAVLAHSQPRRPGRSAFRRFGTRRAGFTRETHRPDSRTE